ncbi:MAG: hypothetical protein WA215_03410 [Candidatus Cybelea sp.]
MAAPALSHLNHPDVILSRRKAFEALKAELSAKASLPSLPIEGTVATAIPELDRLLAGGFPSGSVAILEGSTGRWSVAVGLVSAMTRRSLVAILDDGALYPPGLADAGVCLERVLIVPVRKALEVARAADILLRSRICRLILMPAIALRDSIWARLARLAQRNGVLLIVMATRAGAALSAVAELRLHCALERIIMRGTHGLWGGFAGFELRIDLRKHKHVLPGCQAHMRALSS